MIRALTTLGAISFIAAIALIVGTDQIPVAIVLLLVSIAISTFLAARRGFQLARNVLRDASHFVSGDVQRARIADVSDPKGIFFPKSTVAFELQGDDDTSVHRMEKEVPIPLLAAWSYRLGKRFNLPFLSSFDPAEMMAVELRREGLSVTVARS